MSTEVKAQVRDYTRFYVSTITPIEVDEILSEGVGTEAVRPLRPRRPQPRLPRWVYAVAAAVAVLVLVGGGLWLAGDGSGDGPVVDEPEPDPTSTVPEGESMGDPAGWDWTPLDQRDFQSLPILSDGRDIYRVEEELWMSPDGSSWQPIPGSAPPKDWYEGSPVVGPQGRVLIAWDSAADPSGWPDGTPPEPVIITLIEPGGTVHTSELTPQIPEALAEYATTPSRSAAVAVGPHGGLIWTSAPVLDASAIARAVFGDEFTEDRNLVIEDGMAYLKDFDLVETVAGPVPLAELGIDPVALAEASRLWVTSDFRDWQPVTPSGPFDTVSTSELLHGPGLDPVYCSATISPGPIRRCSDFGDLTAAVGIEDGFLALARHNLVDSGEAKYTNSEVWFSPDGIGWQLLGRPGGDTTLMPWRGQALLYETGTSDNGGVLQGISLWHVTSDGMERWFPPSVRDEEGHVFLAAGDAGIVYLLNERREIVYSPDGVSWSRARIPEFVELADPDSCFFLPQLSVAAGSVVSIDCESTWQATTGDGSPSS